MILYVTFGGRVAVVVVVGIVAVVVGDVVGQMHSCGVDSGVVVEWITDWITEPLIRIGKIEKSFIVFFISLFLIV